MTFNPKKVSDVDMSEMCRDDEKYKKFRKHNTELARKSRYGIYDKKRIIVTDKKIIKEKGRVVLCALKDEFLFSNIAFLKKDLCDLTSISSASVSEWTTTKHILPPPMFKGKVTKLGKWRDVYILEEVLVILHYLAEGYQRMHFFRQRSPECFAMNQELEAARNEIKRRLRANEPTIWTPIN